MPTGCNTKVGKLSVWARIAISHHKSAAAIPVNLLTKATILFEILTNRIKI